MYGTTQAGGMDHLGTLYAVGTDEAVSKCFIRLQAAFRHLAVWSKKERPFLERPRLAELIILGPSSASTLTVPVFKRCTHSPAHPTTVSGRRPALS